jgi:hypothetical protein
VRAESCRTRELHWLEKATFRINEQTRLGPQQFGGLKLKPRTSHCKQRNTLMFSVLVSSGQISEYKDLSINLAFLLVFLYYLP